MARTGVFDNNSSKATSLDASCEPANARDGGLRAAASGNEVWEDFFDAPGAELGPRNEPPAQTREPF